MDPDSRWILREMVSWPDAAAMRLKDRGQAGLQHVHALLSRHTAGESIYAAIRRLDEPQQQFVAHWVEVIARSDAELARVFASRAVQALSQMDFDGVEAWLVRAMDAYDKRGLGYAINVIEDLEAFAADYAEWHVQVSLDEEQARLQALIIGLGGRPLAVSLPESSDPAFAWTDTESIYLPARFRHFRHRELNRQMLTLQAVYLWAQNRYGTWRLKPLEQLSRMPAPKASTECYAHLECYRITACLQRELPGLARRLRSLDEAAGIDRTPPGAAWNAAVEQLTDAGATAADSLAWIDELREKPLPPAPVYLGAMFPDRVRKLLRRRVAAERDRLRRSLSELEQRVTGDSRDNAKQNEDQTDAPKPGGQFSLAESRSSAGERSVTPQLEYRGRSLPTPPDVRGLLTSIQQDLGEVPEDYLSGGGDTPYDASAETPMDRDYSTEPLHYADGAISYPEWDYNRQRYRPDYCLLQEHTVKPGDPNFIIQTLQKYRGPLKSIRRSFEAVRGEDRLLRRQADGDEIDIDALVEAQADRVRGAEMDDRLYCRHRRVDRDIAVMFMVDMSGSTRGWVNDAERESLVLLCEALETLGDRYAIYGFSGRTHSRCAIYHIKRFDEAYDRTVRDRISGIRPQTYTRMGVAIRHLSGLLRQVPARTRLLVTLSDGKPEDYGSYRGKYGIEDTRRALIEARRDGSHAFCITIDSEGGDYLPHMYGPANYAVIDQVSQLPLKVADIYRKLTT